VYRNPNEEKASMHDSVENNFKDDVDNEFSDIDSHRFMRRIPPGETDRIAEC